MNKQSRSPGINVKGRTFHLGKPLVKDTRSLIIDDIVRGGEDVSPAFYSGRFTTTRKKNTKLVVIQF